MSSVAVRAPVVVIDMNAWISYFDEAMPAARAADPRRLMRAKERRVVRAVLTEPLTQEIMRTCPAKGFDRYRAMMRFAWNACGARVLKTESDCQEMELRLRRRLTWKRDEPLMNIATRIAAREHEMFNEERVRSVAAKVVETHDQHWHDEPLSAATTVDGLRPHRKWRRRLLPTPEARAVFATEWALDDMTTMAKSLGLPDEDGALPDPRTLPAFFVPALVHVTHMHGVLIEEYSPTATDLYDRAALHAAGTYADILVTADAALARLAAATGLPLRVLDYDEWNEHLRRLVG